MEHVASGVNVGRPRALTSLEETLILNIIIKNPGIYKKVNTDHGQCIHYVHWFQELVDTAGCLLWFLPA